MLGQVKVSYPFVLFIDILSDAEFDAWRAGTLFELRQRELYLKNGLREEKRYMRLKRYKETKKQH